MSRPADEPTGPPELSIELTGGLPAPGLREVDRVGSVALLMLPGAVAVRTGAAAHPARRVLQSYLPFPSWGTTRLLLPVESPAAAAAAVTLRAPSGRGAVRRLVYRAASQALRAGVVQHVQRSRVHLVAVGGSTAPATVSLAQHIGAVLGRAVLVAPSVGQPDPHRTVGMHVLGLDGELVAFAKVAGDSLPAVQVRTEGHALKRLAQVPAGGIEVPRVLHEGVWNGLTVLVTSPLDLVGAHQPTVGSPPGVDMMRVIARSGQHEVGPLADSEYWRATRQRLETLAVPGSQGAGALATELFDGLQSRAGGVRLEFGGWHGDLLPWNLARRTDRLLIWDWEYWSPAAPFGFDMLHYFCGTLFSRNGWDAGAALEAAHTRAGPLLRAAGFGAASFDLVYALYVLEFLLRRLDIATHGGGRDDHRVFPAVVPVARRALSRAVEASAPGP